MFVYEKKLQYPINIKTPNPKLAKMIFSQFGGADAQRDLVNAIVNSATTGTGTLGNASADATMQGAAALSGQFRKTVRLN